MLYYIMQGLLLGIAYVAPIGMQNLNVMSTAIQEKSGTAFQVAVITIVFDILLALACFFGVGLLIDSTAIIKMIILAVGSAVILYIGFSLILKKPGIVYERKKADNLFKRIMICFAVTWLNPQAIIDGSMLLGGYYASVPAGFQAFFISGFCLASAIWFLFITVVTLLLKEKLNSKVIRIINIVCGIILIGFGVRLVVLFISLL